MNSSNIYDNADRLLQNISMRQEVHIPVNVATESNSNLPPIPAESSPLIPAGVVSNLLYAYRSGLRDFWR